MEDLNTQQIILLTLLVSFVTSIATGITTVSLLEQAPEPVTQTINRVVEKTIERVIEVDDEDKGPVEREVVTVVVGEEELTIEAVQKNTDNLVRIYQKNGDLKTFVSLGVVISADGNILIDSGKITDGFQYVGEFSFGEYLLSVQFREVNNPFAILNITEETEQTFSVAKFSNSQNLKLAQSVIALSGNDNDVVTTGRITSLEGGGTSVDPTNGENLESRIEIIDTSVDADKILTGALLLNLNGEIIGSKIGGDTTRSTAFISSNRIKDFLNSQTNQ